MKVSIFFIPGALLFWGWQVQTLWIAVIFVLVIVASEWSNIKFELSVPDFNKFVDVSTIILAGAIVLALTLDAQKAIWILLKWLPAILFPIIAAQKFSIAGKIDIQSFFLTTRRSANRSRKGSGKKNKEKPNKKLDAPGRSGMEVTPGLSGSFDTHGRKIDVSYLYALFCILSSGVNQSRDNLFFITLALFSIWALWHVRSKRVPVWIWSGVVVLAIGFGYIGHRSVLMASMKLNHWMISHYTGLYSNNPFKTHTALGEIGKLKRSNNIVLRAVYENYKQGNTYLLYNGFYNKFLNSNWFAGLNFDPIASVDNKTVWQINPEVKPALKMTLYFKPDRKKVVLNLPDGTMNISNLKADKCQKNQMQVVRVDGASPIISADVSYTNRSEWDLTPYNKDFLIPRKEAAALTKVVDGLKLSDKTQLEILSLIKTYFSSNYTYSLELKGKGEHDTPLQNFLFYTRKGHCELFATATTLILRAAGIPARYVTGFIVHEYSELENRLVVRQRDAHAWVKAFIDGKWQIVDTTPSGFLEQDSQLNPSSIIGDFFSYLGFTLSQIRHDTGKDFMNRYGLWLILPLVVLLILRLRKTNQIKQVKQSSNPMVVMNDHEIKVSFYLLEIYLSKKGMPRYSYETFTSWIKRIKPYLKDHNMHAALKMHLKTHNRMRFGNSGVTGEEKENLYMAIEKTIRNDQEK